jgi:hypothetical protein
MSWPDPGEGGRDILEREPGRLSALLTRLGRLAALRRRRWVAGLVAAALLATGGAVLAAQSHRPAVPTITNARTDGASTSLTCGELSMTATTSQPAGPWMIFGDVVLPGPGTGIIDPVHDAGWRYEIQTAFLVRGASPPVTVSVPRAWRTVAGIAPLGSQGERQIRDTELCEPPDVELRPRQLLRSHARGLYAAGHPGRQADRHGLVRPGHALPQRSLTHGRRDWNARIAPCTVKW